MKLKSLFAADVAGAREEIFDFIQRNPNNNNIIYYHGYGGFGAATVLRSIARVLPSMKDPPPKLCFGRTIYIDCSRWISNREMQRKITQELKLDQMTRGMFEEQDEEDDFNGVDLTSRDTIRSVTVVIDRTLRKSRFMIIFINGSDDELDLRRFGIPEYLDCVVLWTFSKGRFMMTTDFDSIPDDMIASKIRYTDAFLYYCKGDTFKSSSEIISLFREEATNIVVAGYPYMQGTDDLLAIVVYCCLYRILLLRYNSFCAVTTGCSWPPHAPIYWICDGIIQGDRAREISNSLHSELSFQCDAAVLGSVFRQLKKDPESPFIEVTDDVDYEKRPYCRWISITLKKEKLHDIQRIYERSASSIFLAFETKDRPYRLPNDLFNQSNNILGVLVLSCCAFSFVSPPFLNCIVLRFLGLVHCMDDNSVTQLEGGDCATRWECLQTLWAIDMYCTDWFEILSKEKLELMSNLMELNIEGVRCSWLTSHLLEILPYLQRLRLIKPKYDADTADMSNSSVDKINIEILDLSGDRGLTSLPAVISKANHLQVLILDGCDGLEEVVLSGNMSLRSFSFDSYGPAESHRTSSIELPPIISRPKHPVYAEKKSVVKTSKVSLKGCTQLDNLFLRGLPNLEELDLSGCAIKVLDFGAMVVDVPRLKRLFLLGCENLHAIKWGSYEQQLINQLELICIDTRPVSGRALGCFQPASSLGIIPWKQLHAIFVDARLARSLVSLTEHYSYYTDTHPHFNISITSSATCTETIQPEATTNKAKVSGSIDHHADYHDVFTKIGNEPAPVQAFPQGPMKQLEWHTEIGNGSRNVQSEVEADPSDDNNLAKLMKPTQSLHVHDVSTYSNTMPTGPWFSLRWCRIERCPNFHAIFPPGAEEINGILKTIWASDLLMARCVWSKDVIIEDSYYNLFMGLQHLHLRCCPSLQFGLAIGAHPSFHSLETLHIIHCGQLRHVFIPWDNQHTSIKFPVLTTIHLHDLPALLQIFKATKMLAPALETIKIRGCSSLRRLPALKGRKAGMRRPTVEIEKDVWDALEWDGVDAGHHPSLYEAPVHSRYYKRHMLRTTVLR